MRFTAIFVIRFIFVTHERFFTKGKKIPKDSLPQSILVVKWRVRYTRDQYARRHRFWWESGFLWREENWKKPLESDWDQPITAHVQAQDRTQVAVVGGADDVQCANLTPLLFVKGPYTRYSLLVSSLVNINRGSVGSLTGSISQVHQSFPFWAFFKVLTASAFAETGA